MEVNDNNFSALTKLYGLRLSGNKLSTIKDDVFANLDNLNVLNLSHNRITMIGERSFKNLNNLRALRLDNNMLVDLNGLVSSLDNLRWLNVSTNNLQWFDFASIPKSLEWLDVHNNRIKRIGNYYRFASDPNCQELQCLVLYRYMVQSIITYIPVVVMTCDSVFGLATTTGL